MKTFLATIGVIAIVLFFLNDGGCSVGSHGNSVTIPDKIDLPGGTYGERK